MGARQNAWIVGMIVRIAVDGEFGVASCCAGEEGPGGQGGTKRERSAQDANRVERTRHST